LSGDHINGTPFGQITCVNICKKYVGKYNGNYRGYEVYQGQGTMTFKSGSEYQGKWLYGKLYGLGTITFCDGFTLEGKWEKNIPQFDATHPSVRKCIKDGLCTKTLM
jgi:hypothetical protein